MYSGGWEVVGKNKKDKAAAKTGKLSKAEKKKFIENAPKVEDFLPLDQVKTLYDNLEGNKENKKPVKEKESKTKENEEKKKQQKKQQQQQQQVEKKEESPKVKLPKSIEGALNLIDVSEVQNLLDSSQTRFPDAPLVWLKTLAAFLNSKIPVDKDDPMFSTRPDGYPFTVVPKNLRVVLEKAIANVGESNTQLFYEYLLTVLTTDMTNNTPVVGYKILIQLLSKYNSQLCINNIPKLISLRNSYQNRKPVGLSLLWSFIQGGRENLSAGLKVWHEVMAPMLEAKSYSTYILKILNDLLAWHEKDENLQQNLYLDIFDDFFSGKINISQPVINEGMQSLRELRTILFQNRNINYRKLFEIFTSKATIKTPQNLRDEIIEVLTSCLSADERCYNIWKSLYMKNLYTSSVLVSHIESNWCSLQPPLNPKSLQDILSAFQLSYEKSKKGKGKDDKYLQTCNNTSQKLIKKMASKKTKQKGGFPWRAGCFFLLILVGAIVAYDTHKHGSFEATSTGKFMRDSGITAGVQKSWATTKFYWAKGLENLEAASPEYYKATVTFFKPFVKLSNDVYLTVKHLSIRTYGNIQNYVTTKVPLVAVTIEQYAPGLLESIHVNSLKAIEIIKTYSALIAEQAVENSVKATRWLKTNVFVGKFSPESLQNYASQAINTTQTFAIQTYDWMYEKVQTLTEAK